jgi:hypothetical protein
MYQKPGVEITQVFKTQHPVLNTPDLQGVVIGVPYRWFDMYDNNGNLDADMKIVPSNPPFTITDNSSPVTITKDLTTINNQISKVIGDTVIVKIKFANAAANESSADKIAVSGKTFYVKPASTVYSVDSGDNVTLSISSFITKDDLYDDESETITGLSDVIGLEIAEIYVGFVAEMSNGMGMSLYTSLDDVELKYGVPMSFTPLAYGLKIAMENSASQFYGYGYSDTEQASSALDDLELFDIYVMAPMEAIDFSDVATYKAHVDTMSDSTHKAERKVYITPSTGTYTYTDLIDSTSRANFASYMKLSTAAIADRRVIIGHPNKGYIKERRNVVTLHPNWIKASLETTASSYFNAANDVEYVARLAVNTTLNNVLYEAGTLITATLLETMVKYGPNYVDVFVPAPGYYYTAAAAGLAIGVQPQIPLTYHVISGIDMTYGGKDALSETNLNMMAEGGVMISVQDDVAGLSPIYIRHQLTTDTSSIEKREQSITTQIDYAAKFIRKILTVYAGRYNVTSDYLKLVKSAITVVGKNLVNKGYIASFTLIDVKQDPDSPDVVLSTVTIGVKYPGNYIKVTLVI